MAIPNEPLTRSEQYLNRTATGSGTIPEEPLTRAEMYLNKIATGSGNTPDEPLTRIEQYLDYIAENGGGGVDPESITLETLNVSQNGTTNAPSGTAYNKVVANVPNTYAAADEGKVVEDGALVSQTDETISQNGTVDTTTVKQVTVNVPNSYGASDEGKVVDNGSLVAQTAHAEVTQNGTIDTTLNNSVTVNVPQGSTPTGTKQISITENGTTTEDVAAYANAEITVNVPSGGGDYVAADFFDMSKPIGEVTSSIVTPSIGMKGRTGVTKITLTNATSLPADCFVGCTSLATVIADKVTTIAANSMRKMALVYAVLPSLTTMDGTYQFYENTNTLLGVDFGGVSTSGNIASYAFRNQIKMKTVILRGTSLWTLDNVSAFSQTVFSTPGFDGGTIYIPEALYNHLGDGTANDYKAATNWSTLDGYGYTTWAKIEGSYYETHYADGRAIPSA